ncbi:MAG: trigger factor [Alphaproteobacteria bacterium]
MQVTETNAEGLKRAFKVQLEAREIDEKLNGRLVELGNNVKVPGFRPGKVPIQILKQRYGKSVLGEVLERAVTDSSSQALNERGLRPAMQPKIEITSFDEGKDLEYTIELELLPDVQPMDFSQIELERTVIEIAEEAVEETIRDLAKSQKKTKPLETPRAAQNGDVLVIDFAGTVDGEAYPGMAGEDHHLELGTNSFIAGFEDQLIGAAVGDAREVNVTFPEEYGNERLAGQNAVFKVTVKDMLESVPMAVDDELATALGEADLAALKERVRERIAGEYKEFGRSRLKRQLLDHLADGHDFPVPEGMVNAEFDAIWKQIEQDREADKLDPEDTAKDEDALKSDYRDIAVRRVRLGLLISEVGRINDIEVTEEEANMALYREAQQYPGKERQVFEFYQNTPEAMANLRAPVFEDKVVDFITDLAKVTERSLTAEQLREEVEAEAADAAESKKKPAKKKAAKKTAEKPDTKAEPKKKPAKKATKKSS